MASAPGKIRIGDLLVDAEEISHEQLSEALALQKTVDKKLGRILIEMGAITEERLFEGAFKAVRFAVCWPEAIPI